jgi:outer membrane receptor protein involved in Fe transport
MHPEGDGLALQRNDIHNFTGYIHSFSQEIRLANNTDPTFRWTIGANYSDDRINDSIDVWYKDSTAAAQFGWFSSSSSVYQAAKNYAGFGSAEYTIGQFTLKGGARYTEADRRAVNCLFALNDDGQTFNSLNTAFGVTTPGQCLTLSLDPATFLQPHAVPGKLNQHNVSWRAGIDWKPTNDILIYANVSKGYKAGSYSNFGSVTDVGYSPVTQESVLTYEGGIKAQLFNRKLSINAAGFYSDYTDKQIKSKRNSGFPFYYLLSLVNVPKSRIQGFEVETTARPVLGLTIGGAATYLDTKIKNSVGPDGNFLATLVPLDGPPDNPIFTNSAGNPIPYTSKWTLSGNVNYDFSIGSGSDAFVGGQIMYRTKTNASIGNEPIVAIPGYATVDLQAGVNFRDGKYSMMVWGKNVFNKFYITNRNFSFDGVAQFAGRPVTYGITLSAKY